MATNLLLLRPAMIRPCAVSTGTQKSNLNRWKNSSDWLNWWTPLFGWSSELDYIGPENKPDDDVRGKEEIKSEGETKPVKSRFAPGCFAEEKARQLHKLTSDTTSFHDVMYHSPIASRLASALSHARSILMACRLRTL